MLQNSDFTSDMITMRFLITFVKIIVADINNDGKFINFVVLYYTV